MIYTLKLVYHDNKDLIINIASEKLQSFFVSLNGKQMYFDESNNMGFWTDLDKIRYVQCMQVVTPDGGLDAQSKAAQSDTPVPMRDVPSSNS